MFWTPLHSTAQLSDIEKASYTTPQLLFKHSTRCGISLSALHTVENESAALSQSLQCHYLDLLNYREVSHAIAAKWNIPHQSPQAIVIKNGEAIYSSSHAAISPTKILLAASK